MPFSILSLVFVLVPLVLHFLVNRILYYRNLPPGPWGLPFIGSLLHLSRVNPLAEFQKYKGLYGKIFSIGIGHFNVIVINDYKLIREALRREEFSDRPNFEIWKSRNGGDTKDRGIVFCDLNAAWAEQRKSAHAFLKYFGSSTRGFEALLLQELGELLEHMIGSIGVPVDLSSMCHGFVLNSLWHVLTGKRFEIGEPQFQRIMELMRESTKVQFLTGAGFFFPSSGFRLWWNRADEAQEFLSTRKEYSQNLTQMIQSEVRSHQNTFKPQNLRDFIYWSLNQIENSDPGSSFHGDSGLKNLEVVLKDLFGAGAETTSTTLHFAILNMCRYPEIQSRARAEIDSILGKRTLPSISFRQRLVYIEAVLNEVHRTSSIFPFSLYHQVSRDTELAGYFIPKNSVVFPNLSDAHNDEAYWKDPHNFRPERWLNATNSIIRHEAFMPFSTGKRACLGAQLARDTIFIFFVGLLQRFEFEFVDEENFGSNCCKATTPSPTMVRLPIEFKMIIKER